MTIRHLKIFIEVARCGKMSKAAANLYISQPTVSQTISELEDHYKVRLFERFPNPCTSPAREKSCCSMQNGLWLLWMIWKMRCSVLELILLCESEQR